MFTEAQKTMLIEALTMSINSNKRMQQSKPAFKVVFDQIDKDLGELMVAIKNIKTTPAK